MNFSTQAKSLKEAGKYNALVVPHQAIYEIIKGDELLNAFKIAIDNLKTGKKENSAYHKNMGKAHKISDTKPKSIQYMHAFFS